MPIRQDGVENCDEVYCVYTFLKGEIEDLTVTWSFKCFRYNWYRGQAHLEWKLKVVVIELAINLLHFSLFFIKVVRITTALILSVPTVIWDLTSYFFAVIRGFNRPDFTCRNYRPIFFVFGERKQGSRQSISLVCSIQLKLHTRLLLSAWGYLR